MYADTLGGIPDTECAHFRGLPSSPPITRPTSPVWKFLDLAGFIVETKVWATDSSLAVDPGEWDSWRRKRKLFAATSAMANGRMQTLIEIS